MCSVSLKNYSTENQKDRVRRGQVELNPLSIVNIYFLSADEEQPLFMFTKFSLVRCG